MSTQRRTLLLVFISSFLVLFQLGKLALMDCDESRYAESAREMLVLKEPFIPHLNFQPRINKPVLFYWLIAFFFKLSGINEFSARLPSALSGLAMIVFLYLLVSRQIGEKEGFISGLVLASTPMWLVISRLAIIDALYSILIFSSLGFFWLYFRNKKFLIPAFLTLGLSMSAKGPAGLCIIFITLLLFSVVEKRIYYIKKFFHPGGILIFALSGLFWYLLLIFKIGWPEFKNLALTETLGRFKGGFVHAEPFYYFLPIIFGGFSPWILFLGKLRLRILWENKFLKYILCYTLGGLVFFSLCRTKLPTYIFPLFPGLAILTSVSLVNFWEERSKLSLVGGVFFLALGLSVVFFSHRLAVVVPKGEVEKIALGMFLGGILFLFLSRLKFKKQFVFLFLTVPVIYFCLLIRYGDNYSNYRSTKNLFKYQSLPSGEELYALGFFKPSLNFYSRRKVIIVDSIPGAGRYLVMKNEDYLKYHKKIPLFPISRTKKYTLVKLQKLQY